MDNGFTRRQLVLCMGAVVVGWRMEALAGAVSPPVITPTGKLAAAKSDGRWYVDEKARLLAELKKVDALSESELFYRYQKACNGFDKHWKRVDELFNQLPRPRVTMSREGALVVAVEITLSKAERELANELIGTAGMAIGIAAGHLVGNAIVTGVVAAGLSGVALGLLAGAVTVVVIGGAATAVLQLMFFPEQQNGLQLLLFNTADRFAVFHGRAAAGSVASVLGFIMEYALISYQTFALGKAAGNWAGAYWAAWTLRQSIWSDQSEPGSKTVLTSFDDWKRYSAGDVNFLYDSRRKIKELLQAQLEGLEKVADMGVISKTQALSAPAIPRPPGGLRRATSLR